MLTECQYNDRHSCDLLSGATQIVLGDGDLNSEVFIIGEAPGADEDRIGKPFIGRSGKLLDKILAEVGINREQTYITNVVKCRPPDNRKPTKTEIMFCWNLYLSEELWKEKKPFKVIVTLGHTAFSAVTGIDHKTMKEITGKIFNCGGKKLIPTYHPSAALRNREWKEEMIKAFERVHAILHK